jgi:hypothetical protein
MTYNTNDFVKLLDATIKTHKKKSLVGNGETGEAKKQRWIRIS